MHKMPPPSPSEAPTIYRHDAAAPDRRRLVTKQEMVKDFSEGAWDHYSQADYTPELLGEELAASLTATRTLTRACYQAERVLLSEIARVHKEKRPLFARAASIDIQKIRSAADDCLSLRGKAAMQKRSTTEIARILTEQWSNHA